MADGTGGIEARLETLAAAVMKQTEQVAEMRGTMKSFIDFELAAKQRLEIRVETEGMIQQSTEALSRELLGSRGAVVSEAKNELRSYTDTKVRELELRLAAQEDRDKKRETDIRTQFIGLGVVGIAGIAYALWNVAGGSSWLCLWVLLRFMTSGAC